MSGARVTSASLDSILAANGQPTTEDLQRAAVDAMREKTAREKAAIPRYMNAKQRQALKRTLAKQGQTLLPEDDTK